MGNAISLTKQLYLYFSLDCVFPQKKNCCYFGYDSAGTFGHIQCGCRHILGIMDLGYRFGYGLGKGSGQGYW